MEPTQYILKCLKCGKEYEDKAWRLTCDDQSKPGHGPSLLRAMYSQHNFTFYDNVPGILAVRSWLPVTRSLSVKECQMIEGRGAPVVYHSTGLANALGLTDLWIGFSGYDPSRGACMNSCTFKELEALCCCLRADPEQARTRSLVVASAGNTARAFAQVYSDTMTPVLIVIPEPALSNMWALHPFSPQVRLVTVCGAGADYTDAIKLLLPPYVILQDAFCRLAGLLAQQPECYPEGGALNVARRDGMGIVVLNAARAMHKIPQ